MKAATERSATTTFDRPPLVIDLDGTLIATDTLVESVLILLRRTPRLLFVLPLWLLRGKANFKETVASLVRIDPSQLPYRESLLRFLREERKTGRKIFLATAAHQSIASKVAEHLGVFDGVLASENGVNLKGKAKLEAIRKHIGERFVYAGDSGADVPVWRESSAAILVSASERVSSRVRQLVPIECEVLSEPVTLATWFRAARVHQWVKNLLLFVPALTAFSLQDGKTIVSVGIAFVSFSLAASASYIANDVWDLQSDRHHPRKRARAFAAGQLSIVQGLAIALALIVASFLLSLLVSAEFSLAVLAYLAMTTAYSVSLKEYVLVDVLVLALLFTIRILAGAFAAEVNVSSWLLAFSVFVFLSLALVKRCAELKFLESNALSAATGRDYRVADLAVMWPLGVGAALSAVVIFGLFISSVETQSRYASPQILWLVAVGMIYWLGRVWIKTSRGEMHDDPVVFALRDRASRIVVVAIFALVLSARWLSIGGA